MKRIIFYSIVLTLFYSCSDSDDGPSCPTGYFGENCDIPVNSVYDATWSAEQVCSTSGEESFNLTFSPSEEDPLEFSITGMWGESDETITVLIDPKNRRKFSYGTQPLGFSGFTIEVLEGEISKVGDGIQMDYIIYSGTTQIESCTVICSR